MKTTVSDIIRLLETIAPIGLAEDWDNVGLQVGKKEWPVHSVWIALDPIPDVVEAACREDIDLLITHHPLIFRPIQSLDFNTPLGAIFELAVENRLSIVSAHTNLDSASGGINDVLASAMGLKNLTVLGDDILPDLCQLSLYVTPEHEQNTLNILIRSGGEKDGTSFFSGTVTSLRRSSETVSQLVSRGTEERVRLDATLPKKDSPRMVQALKQTLPPGAFDYEIAPRVSIHSGQGLGRIGELESPAALMDFAQTVKNHLKLSSVRVAGDETLMISKVALCSGSGSGLLPHFFASDAQAYVSGDFRYHDARDSETNHRGLIDIGHFGSERIIIDVLAQRLQHRLTESNMDVRVEACRLEKEPFMII